MQNILSRLDALREKLHDEAFLSNKGLSNEVGLYVFAYRPDEEMPVRHFLHSIAASENGQNGACRVIAYDLYDLLLDICRERRILDRIAQMEAQHGADFMLRQIQRVGAPGGLYRAHEIPRSPDRRCGDDLRRGARISLYAQSQHPQ